MGLQQPWQSNSKHSPCRGVFSVSQVYTQDCQHYYYPFPEKPKVIEKAVQRERDQDQKQGKSQHKKVPMSRGRLRSHLLHPFRENPLETPAPFQSTVGPERREKRKGRLKPKNMLKNNNAPAYNPRTRAGGQCDQPAP